MNNRIKYILTENEKRNKKLFEPYDPIMGFGSPIERVPIFYYAHNEKAAMVPKTMEQEDFYQEIATYSSIEEYATSNGLNVEQVMNQFNDLRMNHDFELYAATTITIQDKLSKKKFKLKCRRSQRKILKELERMRIAGEPIRAILLKARQLGGSTLIQCYFFWIQDRLKENWHSAIFADVEDQAKNIRGMYTTISDYHPVNKVTLKPFEQSSKVRIYKERGNIIGVGSMQKPDSIRGYDYAMVHCSEVGLWKKTEGKSPKDLVQSIRAALADVPYSCEILESTAKGVGNFFHKEWTAAKRKESGYTHIFVAWWEIELYWKKVEGDVEEFIKTWNSYEKWLWNIGATIEGIYWYRYYKKAKQYDDWRMKSEFPSTDIEAFQSTGRRFFKPEIVERARRSNRAPDFIGDLFADGFTGPEAIENISFSEVPEGNLSVWLMPETFTDKEILNRYVVSLDIGGRSDESDNSVIKVIDRYWMLEGGIPEVAAVWAGHLDFDKLAWKAIQICKFYNNAFYIPEINKMSEKHEDTEGINFITILDEIIDYYDNIYTRSNPEQVRAGAPVAYGFHTNKTTKPRILNALNKAWRDDAYYEYDERACDEGDQFEIKENGSFGAVDGAHDDHVIATALAVWAALDEMPPVEIVPIKKQGPKKPKHKSFSTI
ncbi:MAG: hypothetical protein VYB44_07190 [Bacteroidota bacterium]|nr:hypothetical protein [Bacteroidota bacterium]